MKAVAILRRIWLPLFLLSGLSWLFAPAYYHDHYGTLQLISAYESGPLSLSWLFRAGDVVSGLLLAVAPWLFGLMRRDKWLGWMVVLAGVLSAIDGAFDNVCLNQGVKCIGWATLSSQVHDAESVLLAVLIVVMGLYHARRYRRWISILFVLAQLAIVLFDLSVSLDKQAVAVSQYAYEVLAISWLAWLVGTWAPLTYNAYAERIRRLFGLWALLNGALALIVTLTHHQLLAPLFDISLAHSSSLVGQHGIIAGVLMLYLARHVYQGQRRAALLLLLVFGSEVIKYSVLTPSPVLLSVNLLSFVLLLYARRSFDRNVLPLPFEARLKDVGIVLGGAAVAILASLTITNLAGHGQAFQDGVIDSYQGSVHVAQRDRNELRSRINHRTQVVGDTLVIALIGVTAWGLFRPAKLSLRPSLDDRHHAERLLSRYSTSTEDFFKLWPADKSYFFAHGGFVAYKVVAGVAFAVPDPIAEHERSRLLLADFRRHCRDHGWAVCFLAVPVSSRRLYRKDFKLLKMGSSAIIDVKQFAERTSRDKWWRWQRNRASKGGLRYELSLPPHDSHLLAELKQVSDAWLADGEHREQGFVLGYFDDEYLKSCRLHLLRNAEDELVAFANELPVYGHQMQRTVDLIRYRPGQDGAMPYLLLNVIEQLKTEGQARTFDLGFVPLAGIDSNLLRILRRLAVGRFSSLGLEQFKNKFDPAWQASYLAYQGDVIDLARIATSLETALRPPTTP